MRLFLLGLVACLAWGAPRAAEAQECSPTEAQMQEGRALFNAAVAAAEEARWSDAIPSFERAYQLTCRGSVLYNLAMALRALGRHREARDRLQEFLRRPDVGDLQARAQEALDAVSERVAVLELAGLGGLDEAVGLAIGFDGHEVRDSGERPLRIETDAGSHTLVVRRPEYQPYLWEGVLSDGQTEQLTVTFEPLAEGGGLDVAPIVVTIVALAVVAAGAGAAYYVIDDAQLRPLNPDRVIRLGSP